MKKFHDERTKVFAPAKFDVDSNLELVMDVVKDPFGTFVYAESYYDSGVSWTQDQCMDSVVAGISESLGLPQGLSFDEVFSRVG